MVLRGRPGLRRGNSLCKGPEVGVLLVRTHEAREGGDDER